MDHVGWLLGVNLSVQVVPAAGEEVMHVLAGRSDSVRRRGRELYHAAWDWPARDRASLVIAAIDGRGEQTWEERGPGTPRGPALRRRQRRHRGLLRAGGPAGPRPAGSLPAAAPAAAPRRHTARVARRRPIDALAAAQLAGALRRNKVYLLSRLDPALVEDLDVVPIATTDELRRLARQHRSCLLIPNAPRVAVVKSPGIRA